MTNLRVLPYRTALTGASVDWRRVRGKTVHLLDVDDWDPATDLHLRALVELDVALLKDECGLDPLADVRLFAGWICDGTSLREGILAPTSIPSDQVSHEIDLVLRGAEVAGRVRLDLSVVLGAGGPESSFVPSRVGATLWSERTTVDLGGTATRFPIEVVDFSTIPLRHPEAAWFVDWDANEPDMPVLGGLRLQLNSQRQRVVSAVTTGNSSADAALIREVISYDVARTLLEGALSNWDPRDLVDPDPNSIGEAVGRLAAAIFRGRSFESLRADFATSGGQFEAQIQGYLRLFAGDDPS